MSIKRLLKSIAWKMVPYAGMECTTPSGFRLPVRDSGEWGCVDEIFIQRAYEPFLKHLHGVPGRVDPGCNAGLFFFALLDQLRQIKSDLHTSALLGEANLHCVAQARESIQDNGLTSDWDCRHVVVGPPVQMVEGFDGRQGPSWASPLGTALWENPQAAFN